MTGSFWICKRSTCVFLRADRASLASFEEDALIDMFMHICDVVDRGAERPRKRASLIGERGFDGFGRCWGYFQPCLFHTPIRTPISLPLGKRPSASGAICPPEAAMNSEESERAISGE